MLSFKNTTFRGDRDERFEASYQTVFNRYPDVEAEDDANYPDGFFITTQS